MKICCIFLITVVHFLVYGQPTISKEQFTSVLYSPKELEEDLNYLFNRIEAIHINPYTFTSKIRIYQQIAQARSRLAEPMTALQFWRTVNPIVTSLRDGHTGLGLVEDKIFLADFYFPFDVTCDSSGDAVVVGKNYHDNSTILKGTKIISINGITSSEIMKTLTQHASGEMDSFRQAFAEILFSPLLFWVYGFELDFEIEYVSNIGTHTAKIAGIPKKDFLSQFSLSFADGSKPFELEILDSLHTAIIHFNQFEERNLFQAFLKNSFQALKQKGIRNLIIDIRRNDGGNSNMGDDLIKYLSSKPFTQYGDVLVKVSKEVKKQYPDYKQEDGAIIKHSYEEKNLIEPHPDSIRFHGDVFILISNFTFSSASDFAWCIKHYNLGTLIGDETGQWGTNFGELIYTKLPNTRLDVKVAHKKFYSIGATDGSLHGVVPDYKIKDNPNTDRDEVLDFALRVISKK